MDISEVHFDAPPILSKFLRLPVPTRKKSVQPQVAVLKVEFVRVRIHALGTDITSYDYGGDDAMSLIDPKDVLLSFNGQFRNAVTFSKYGARFEIPKRYTA